MPMRPHLVASVAACAAVLLAATAGCGSSGRSSDAKTVTIAYEDFGDFHAAGQLFRKITPTFEKQHPGWKVKLVPIVAPENDYYTKLDLMNRATSTQPDIMYEDTFLINSDVAAGYLAPLDTYLNGWSDWSQFYPAAKKAAESTNGHIYGVPMDTDTRGLWYNKQIFARAGLPTTWHPTSWADVLAAARAIKAKVPGVTPLNVYAGTPGGEQSTMQGFEELLYGTGETLYSQPTKKWVAPGTGFTSSLNFIKTIYSQGLAPSQQLALNPDIGNIVASQLLPEGKLAIDLDGSWLPGGTWLPGGVHAWPQWSTVMGWTPMPTENGQAPGVSSMSGGWTLAIGKDSTHKAMDFAFLELALNKQNDMYFCKQSGNLTVRQDVASDPAYMQQYPDMSFWTGLVKYTNFRPAYAVYPRISNEIQQSMEQVMTGQTSPQQATTAFGQALRGLVGSSNVQQ
jgi:multiple sugar transport system substrate-binding protein